MLYKSQEGGSDIIEVDEDYGNPDYYTEIYIHRREYVIYYIDPNSNTEKFDSHDKILIKTYEPYQQICSVPIKKKYIIHKNKTKLVEYMIDDDLDHSKHLLIAIDLEWNRKGKLIQNK